MTNARGIVVAGAIALVVTGAHGAYVAWPVVRGAEVYVPAALVRQAAAAEFVHVRLPYERIALLDVPHGAPVGNEPYEPMRRSGNWWTTGGGEHANARALRGRRLFLPLTPGQALWRDGPVEMRASTVSDVPAAGAINLAGTVTFVREDGYLWLDFSFAPLAVPAAMPDGPAIAVLRVLPSGRATLSGVIVNGTRY